MFYKLSKQINLIALYFLVGTLLFGCENPRQPALSVTAESANSPDGLSPQDRIEIFEDIWKTINEQYYDPTFNGGDWQSVRSNYSPKIEAAKTDREFYRLIEEMLDLLRDAHTSLIDPQSFAESIHPPGSVGISLGEAGGETVIATVEPDSDAARAGVKPGMILRSVNGKPVAELYAEIRANVAGSSSARAFKTLMHTALLYGGFLGTSRRFGVEDFNGKLFDVAVKNFGARSSEIPVVAARRLESGLGYIKLDAWKKPADAQFKAELAKMMDAPGLIIDLRDNGGGQSDVTLNIGGLFFAAETSFGSFQRRGGQPETDITSQSEQVYRGRVAILVNETSASASEVFSASMQETGRALIVGRQTCGCVLNSHSKQLKGGGTLLWSARIYTSPKNRILEGVGVTPDKIVPLTVSDLRQGRDAALETAIKLLSSR